MGLRKSLSCSTCFYFLPVSVIIPVLLLIFSSPAIAGRPVNINKATFEELISLDGLSDEQAVAILRYRRAGGTFETIYDLMKVDRMDGKTFEKIKSSITAGSEDDSEYEGEEETQEGGQEGKGVALKSEKEPDKMERSYGGKQSRSEKSSRIPEGRRISPRMEMTSENLFEVILRLMRLSKFDQARQTAEKFIEQYPSSELVDDARYMIAAAFEGKEEYAKAREIYEQVYNDAASDIRVIALYRMAVTDDLQGRSEQAIASYEKLSREYPDTEWAKRASERLKVLSMK